VNVYVSEADPGKSQKIVLEEGRQAYLVAMEGGLTVADVQLSERDAVELVNASGSGPASLDLAAGAGGAHFMLIEMKAA
jgi:redox-sensitive bicupin YhaK (pirin superfamily)